MFHSYISICVFNLSTCFWCCFKILSVCASANVPSLVMFSTSFFCEKQKNIKNLLSRKNRHFQLNAPLECFEKSRATETLFYFYVDFPSVIKLCSVLKYLGPEVSSWMAPVIGKLNNCSDLRTNWFITSRERIASSCFLMISSRLATATFKWSTQEKMLMNFFLMLHEEGS